MKNWIQRLNYFTIFLGVLGVILFFTLEYSNDKSLSYLIYHGFSAVSFLFFGSMLAQAVEKLRKTTSFYVIGFFLLLPMLFSFAYYFASNADEIGCLFKDKAAVQGFWDSVYFSYVTITSLGYGDIIPSGDCQKIAILEAVSGYIGGPIIVAFIIVDLLPTRNQ